MMLRAIIFLAAAVFLLAAAAFSLADHSPWKALAYAVIAVLPLIYAFTLWRKRNA